MLTREQVQFFHDNGYLIMKGLIPRHDLEALRRVADEMQDDAVRKLKQPGYLDGAKFLNKNWIEHPTDHYVYRQKDDGSYSFHRVERGYTQHPLFSEVAMSRRLLNHAWQVLGRPFWPRAGNVVYKLPYEGAEVRWHQDIPYLFWSSGGHSSKGRPTTHPIPNFTTDIYLEASDRTNGCLYAIPGTHRNGSVDVDKMVAEHGFHLPGAVPLEVEAGDVMFHHVAVVHGSPENRSAGLRRTFYVHYLSDETVADAYSDWPDLLSPDECRSFWGDALRRRRANAGAEDDSLHEFDVTPAGIAPRSR